MGLYTIVHFIKIWFLRQNKNKQGHIFNIYYTGWAKPNLIEGNFCILTKQWTSKNYRFLAKKISVALGHPIYIVYDIFFSRFSTNDFNLTNIFIFIIILVKILYLSMCLFFLIKMNILFKTLYFFVGFWHHQIDILVS